MSASVAAKRLALDQDAIGPSMETAGTKRELRVLQVFSVLSVGGAETWLMALLKHFSECADTLPVKVKCDILLTGGEPSVFDEEAKALGARLFYVPFTRRDSLRFARQFRRILSDGNYDVIHDHQDYVAGLHFAMGLGRLPPIRIAHVHNPFFCVRSKLSSSSGRMIVMTGKRLLSYLSTHIAGTSNEILLKYGFDHSMFEGKHLARVHCGFDVSRYEDRYGQTHSELCREFGWGESARIILFVGRLNTPFENKLNQKNPKFALEVARNCIAQDSRIRLLMVGSGDQITDELDSLADEWGLGKQIRLLGVRHDVPRLMTGSDLFLFPSVEEGLGMASVEAQAAGLKVLASDTVPRECVVVPDLVHFHSLDAGASVWANQALRLLNSPRGDLTICKEAIKDSAFSIQNSAAELLKLYAETDSAANNIPCGVKSSDHTEFGQEPYGQILKRRIKQNVFRSITKVMGNANGKVVLPTLTGPARGLRFSLDLNAFAEPPYFYGTYELNEAKAIARICRVGWTVWDCGIYLGYYTNLFARLVGQTGRVVAFEPDPRNIQRTTTNLGLNGFHNVQFVRAAIGAPAQEIDFVISSNTNSHIRGAYIGTDCADYATREQIDETIQIRSLSLDEAFEDSEIPNPDLIKLDIEGSELAALQYVEKITAELRPIIILELHNPECDAAAWDFSQRARYTLESLDTGKTFRSHAEVGGTVLCLP